MCVYLYLEIVYLLVACAANSFGNLISMVTNVGFYGDKVAYVLGLCLGAEVI